jgi:hypothetical protein
MHYLKRDFPMPPTVSVAAFVFGIVLLLAALIGKELKIVTVELPALGPGRRVLLGLLGMGLTVFGLLEGQLPVIDLSPRPAATASPAQPTRASLASAAPAGGAGVAGEGVLPCLGDVVETDLVILPMDLARRTDRKWSTGQPRPGLLAMQFEDPGGVRGGVKFRTLESGAGIDIVGVFDAACQPVTTYSNASRPNQPKDSPYNYDTMRYQIGEFVYVGDIAYGEGVGTLSVRMQQMAP